MDYYITLDVGGTQIKAGVLSASGQLFHNRMETFDSLAKKDRETILKNFFHIITYLAENLDDSHGRIIGIGLAFPGDFNYAEGICLIHDVDKYDSIYGVNLKEELKNYLEHSQAKHLFADNCPIVFLNDIEAFALGESSYGSGTGYPSVFAVCIGTGTGSAFLRHGHIIADPGRVYRSMAGFIITPSKILY